jgi:hypothetical protein
VRSNDDDNVIKIPTTVACLSQTTGDEIQWVIEIKVMEVKMKAAAFPV